MESINEKRNFNPFPGLRPFAPEETDLFFGREKESREVLGKLLKNRFVTVIGASGSGKSSLICCGVLPKVRVTGIKDPSSWRIIILRPGNNPLENLGKAIAENIKASDLPLVSPENILLDMHLNSDGIAYALKKSLVKKGEKVLLVIDQFEEIFRYNTISAGGTRESLTAEFIEKIVRAVSNPDTGIHAIISMRSEYISECMHYNEFTQLINSSSFLVPQMDKEDYRQIIEGPVKFAGAEIEEKLIGTILDDIGNRKDQLPVLQHAMMRTWAHWKELDEPDRPVSRIDYESVGAMRNAMSLHANEAFGELSQRGRVVCERMFRTITEKGPENKGIRRPTKVAAIRSEIQCTEEELVDVAERFRIPSRSFLTPVHGIPLTDDSVIDLSHESLIRLWDRLKEWVENETASGQMYIRLSEGSSMYQQGKASLLRPPDLQLALNWRESQKPTLAWAERYDPAFERAMVYLRTSEKEYLDEEERKLRLQKKKMLRAKISAIILGLAAVIALGFMLFAFIRKTSSDKAARIAVIERQEEERQRQRADSVSKAATLQKIQADSNTRAAIEQKTIAVNERQLAMKNASEAFLLKSIAEERADSEHQAGMIAKENEENALEQKAEALRLRMLSIGKSMSVKSLQLQGQKDLQTLLAYQAYIFNRKNGGSENDADIYSGLYNIARSYGNESYKTYKTPANGEIKSIAFIPGSKEFFTSGNDGKVLKWNTEGRNNTYQVVYSGTDIIEVLAVSPDASWLACGSSNSSIRMIPLKGNDLQYEMNGHNGKIRSLIFSYDGKYLYSASLDGKVLKWDMATRTSTNIATGEMQITSIDIASNGNYIAGINSDGNVIVWRPGQNGDNFRIGTEGRKINVIRFKPDDNILALGDVNGNVELWDINAGKKISEVRAHESGVNDIQFNPLHNQMATAGNDKTLKIFNTSAIADLTEPPVTLSDNEGFVVVIRFSPDGKLIVSGSYEGAQTLVSRPTLADNLISDICSLITRNMTRNEWNAYVAKDIPLENTCPDQKYNIKVDPVK
jgi:WD40 repeat protein/energy-coupling factor transporter ATP-binding protein EcfA2